VTHALLLTAGIGSRLDPLTRLVAKPAVPLGDRTLVEHILAWIGRQGITDVVMNLHHRPASLTAIVGDGAHLGLRVRYSWEDPLLGSAGGPRRALPLVDSDPFLIVNGDTLCDFDLAPLIAAHAASRADVTMAVVPNPAPDHYNGMAVDSEGRVTGFLPRGRAAGTWHFIGVQVAQARVFAGLRDGVPSETVAGFYRDIIAREPGAIRAWPAPTSFLDVGTPRDYLAAALRLGAPHPHDCLARRASRRRRRARRLHRRGPGRGAGRPADARVGDRARRGRARRRARPGPRPRRPLPPLTLDCCACPTPDLPPASPAT
jgi:NDP-sugar pyrophosphorylase family protein